MEIETGNEREGIGIEAAVGTGLADLERVAVAVARGSHGHMARLHQCGVIVIALSCAIAASAGMPSNAASAATRTVCSALTALLMWRRS